MADGKKRHPAHSEGIAIVSRYCVPVGTAAHPYVEPKREEP